MDRGDGERADFDIHGTGALRRFWLYWWIVPRVQTDLADLDYQLYTFEVFHQDWRTKLVHYVTIPAICFFSMAWLARVPLFPGAPPFVDAGALLAVGLAALHFGWCRARGLLPLWAVLSIALVAMWIGGTVYAEWAASRAARWPAAIRLAASPAAWIYSFAFLETMSHAYEPVPPYASGHRRFTPIREFWRAGGAWRVAAALAAPTLFTIVSFVSNLHLLPTLVLRVMASSGFRRDLVDRAEALAAREWRTGQPRIHHVPHPQRALDAAA